MFTIENPWLFLVLPLPFIVKFLLPITEHPEHALKTPFFGQLISLSTMSKKIYSATFFLKVLAFCIWFLLVFAAVSPRMFGDPIVLPQNGRDIMLAVDISGSMQLKDMSIKGQAVDRLAVVKTVGEEFINSRKGDRLGLILFGSRAYLQTPLTF